MLGETAAEPAGGERADGAGSTDNGERLAT